MSGMRGKPLIPKGRNRYVCQGLRISDTRDNRVREITVWRCPWCEVRQIMPERLQPPARVCPESDCLQEMVLAADADQDVYRAAFRIGGEAAVTAMIIEPPK